MNPIEFLFIEQVEKVLKSARDNVKVDADTRRYLNVLNSGLFVDIDLMKKNIYEQALKMVVNYKKNTRNTA